MLYTCTYEILIIKVRYGKRLNTAFLLKNGVQNLLQENSKTKIIQYLIVIWRQMDESTRVKRDVSGETCVTSGEIEQLVPMFMRTDILCVTGFLHVFSAVLQLH